MSVTSNLTARTTVLRFSGIEAFMHTSGWLLPANKGLRVLDVLYDLQVK